MSEAPMTTLEEMAATFWDCEADPQGKWADLAPAYKTAVMRRVFAVLEKNVGPMVEKAHLDGADETLDLFIAKMGARETNVAPGTIARMASDYRARIIAQLTKQNERTG